jgi:glycosyltransferase involved in cell wall biosynthesis
MQNKFYSIITQSEKLKKKYVESGIKEEKIHVIEPFSIKYDLKLPERKDDEIRLIYCGTLRDEENILEIIEEFQNIHKERPEVMLKIVYGKIHGDQEFTEKVNHYIKKGVKGIIFKHNLSHKDACYEIATSDIGICWRKDGWGDDGQVSTKVKEYEMYGLALLSNNIKINSEEIYILYIMKTISDKNTTMFLNNEYVIETKKIQFKVQTIIEKEFNKWKQNVYTLIQNFKIPDKKLILYCKSATKSTSIGGYVERGHQLLKSINCYSNKYYCICVDSFLGARKKQDIQCVTMIDNVIYISMSNILYKFLKNKWSYYAMESYNYIIGLLNIRYLHSPSFYKHSIISIICSKKNNIPHFYEVRGRFDITLFESWCDLKKTRYSKWEKIVENTSQGIFYITNECKDFVEKYDNINVESKILPNSNDITEKECNINNILTSKILFNNSIKFVIGYFGSTYDYENFDLIIPTIDILIQTYKDIGFIFGGNATGGCVIQLNNLQKKHPNNIIIKNYLSKEELLLIYKQLNLFVIPRKDILVSHIITPLKPFELLLKKVPLLMSNVSCLKNISDNGKRCRMFDIKQKDDFLRVIEDIYKNGYSNELLENGYNFAINNGWEKTVEIREQLYNKFIS